MDISQYSKLSGDWEFPCWEWAKAVLLGELGAALPELPVSAGVIHSSWTRIEVGSELPMDLLVFRTAKMKRHVAICMGNSEMAHYGDDGLGVTIERYKSVIWANKLISVYRYVD